MSLMEGYIIEHWASDVGGSNQSIDNVIEYPGNGKTYLVVSDFDQEEPLDPDNYADEWDKLDADGKFYYSQDYAKGGKTGLEKQSGQFMFNPDHPMADKLEKIKILKEY